MIVKIASIHYTLFIITAVVLCLTILSEVVVSNPLGPDVFMPGALDGPPSGPDFVPFVHKDDEGNIYFDVYAVKGEDNRIMYAKNGVLVVSIGNDDVIQNTVEHHLWSFISYILGVESSDIDILLFPGEISRRVLLRNSRLTEQECTNKIKEYLQPYIPGAHSPSKALIHPHTPLAVYAQNDTGKADQGNWKYYEIDTQEDDDKEKNVDEKSEKSLRNKLLELKPYYGKDPSLMAKVLRDLRSKKEVVFRGRLLPGSPIKPMTDDYRGSGKVKLVRRILEGGDGRRNKHQKSKVRLEMSHPVPDLIMLDFLSPDRLHVVSRRLVNPLFRNDTIDLVEELEYTELV